MRRLLDLASKALAVVGVLTLMYAGNGMQQAKAADPPWTVNCYWDGGEGNTQKCGGWWCGLGVLNCRTNNPPLPPDPGSTTPKCCA